MDITEPQLRHWTRDDYYRMAQLGLFTGQRVELIGGEILMMSPMNPDHAASLQLCARALERVFGHGYCVRVQLPLWIDNESEPDPDLAVVPGTPRDYKQHPRTALLVVEVSDSTLAFDRSRKQQLYARASVPEYWIVNLVDRCIEVHRNPIDGCYDVIANCEADQEVTALAAPHAALSVSELLP